MKLYGKGERLFFSPVSDIQKSPASLEGNLNKNRTKVRRRPYLHDTGGAVSLSVYVKSKNRWSRVISF